MLEIFASIRSQIKQLKERIKNLDTKKHKPEEVSGLIKDLESLEERYAKEKAKREEKKLKKEKENEKASETPKETNEAGKEAPKENLEANESASVEKESADVIPEMGTDWEKVLKDKKDNFTSSHGKSCNCVDCAKKKDIVKNVEKKLGPAIIGKFDIDAMVEPVRGTPGSKGKVMRHDKPEDLVYVMWHEGPMKDREQFGGYYPNDIRKVAEEPKPEHPCPCWEDMSAYCPKCKSQKTSDLKSNYMEMLQDLKEEYSEAVAKADYVWVAKLEQKIKDLEAKIEEKFGKEAEVLDHPSGTERLVTIDQTPPGDKANYGPDGKPSESEYMNQLALPDGRNLNAANICAICKEQFNSWPEYNEHRLTKHKPDLVKQPEPKTSALKINVFNKEWNINPLEREGSYSYDVHDTENRKVMNLKPSNGKKWSEAELKLALENELQHGFKQAKLLNKIAFLPQGTKVTILSTSKDGKTAKFASIEHGIRGTTSTSNLKLLALDGQSVAHEGHQDKVLAIHETETLVECPTQGVHWEKKETKLPTHDVPLSQPPATPESLNLEEAKKCPGCEGSRGTVKPGDTYCQWCMDESSGKHSKTSAKDCPDCHGEYVGAENDRCPTCGRYAVDKVALKTALPPTIPNQRGYLDNPPVDKKADNICPACGGEGIEEDNEGVVTCPKCNGTGKIASLNKQARVVHHSDGWHVLSEKGKNLGGPYKSKEEAVKRLRQVEYFKHQGSLRPFSKKAEVLTDPYQTLHTQVDSLRSRMDAVKERLATNPLPKEAGEDEKDNSTVDLPELLEDLAMGIDLLETKLNEEITPEIHENLESMENLLWETEQKLGITPKLSPEEKAEPEHKEIVKEVEKESAISCPACGARLHDRKAGAKCEECGTPVPEDLIVKEAAPIPEESPTSPVAPTPLPQDIRPTDDDNLEVPTQAPTSKLPQGQKWTWDAANGKYVAMTDPMATPGSII